MCFFIRWQKYRQKYDKFIWYWAIRKIRNLVLFFYLVYFSLFSTFQCSLCFDVFYVFMFWCFLCFDVFSVLMFSLFWCFLCFDFPMFWCFLCLYLRKKVWRSTNKILPCLFHWHSEKTLPQKQCIVFWILTLKASNIVHNKKVTFIVQIIWP